MSLINLNFESQALGTNTEVSIILPKMPEGSDPHEFFTRDKRYKVLWLLHGTYGDHTDWIRRTMVETYVRKRDVIVVCPQALNTNYANWPAFGTGYNMYDFLIDELMPFVFNWLPASSRREDNFIAGLSMGGQGACLYAFNHPELFGGMACLSAAPVDLEKERDENGRFWPRTKKGAINYESEDAFVNGYENTMKLFRNLVKEGKQLPKMFFGCGEADDLMYDKFVEFRKEAETMNLKDVAWHTTPGLKHEWKYWDIAIKEVLKYFEIIDRDPNDQSFR